MQEYETGDGDGTVKIMMTAAVAANQRHVNYFDGGGLKEKKVSSRLDRYGGGGGGSSMDKRVVEYILCEILTPKKSQQEGGNTHDNSVYLRKPRQALPRADDPGCECHACLSFRGTGTHQTDDF